LKYWLLTTEYPPFFGGGISTYCDHTARMLAAQGHSVTVFVPDEQVEAEDHRTDRGIRVIRFNPGRGDTHQYLGPVAMVSYAFALIVRDTIRQEGKPDYIESQEYQAIPYYILQFKWLKYPEFQGVPILLTLHSPAFLYLYYNREGIYQYPNYWIGEMEKSCMQAADWIISPSAYMIGEIRLHFDLEQSKVSVLRNPYAFPEVSGQAPIQRNKIVFYGKLSPQKGVFEMFEYFRELWDNGFPHTLTVIGATDKVYFPEMKTMGQVIRDKYAAYIDKGLVVFIGKIPPEQRDAYLSDAHVILVPSMNDNLPYAAIEAMSIGKVVLASVQGGQAEIIENRRNGFLFDHRSPQTFGEQLRHVLTLDDAALGQIGVAASQDIREALDYRHVYRQKAALIEKLRTHTASNDHFPFIRPIPALATPVPQASPTAAAPPPATVPPATPAPPTATVPPAPAHVKGLLTVIIPYYNMGPYIQECLASVKASVHHSMEILIVNDGSTDADSLERLQSYEGQPGIRVLHQKNQGVAYARNNGAREARGEFLAFLDADDRVRADYYSKALAVLEQYRNVSFVGTWVQYFEATDKVWPTWNPEPPYILLHNTVNSSALVYKTAAFLAGGINDKAVDYGLEDYESVVNMMAHGNRGVVLPECLFFYRVRKGSMYRKLTLHKILYSYQYIAHKHAELYSNFAAELYSLQNANGPSYAYDNPTLEVHVRSGNRYPNVVVNRIKSMVKRNPAVKKVLLRIAGRFR